MNFPPRTRRQFLGEASCGLVSSTSLISSLLGLKLANQAAADGMMPAGTDRKTLVNIMLAGGCDTFNALVPTDGRYSEYSASRGGVGGGGVALAQSSLLPLNGGEYGLHPSCAGLQEMFNGTGAFAGKARLAMITNVGTLLRPTSKAQYTSGSHPLPKALFSHIDQITQWQTSLPQDQPELGGWAGRMADLLHSDCNTGATSMSISLAGNNVFQIGDATSQFAITQNGALTPTSGNFVETLKNQALDNLVASTYRNTMQSTLATHTQESFAAQEAFGTVFDAIDDSAVAGAFPNTPLAQQLRAAAKTISAREQLGLRRSTIFIQRGGWDHHGELLNTHSGMMGELSEALYAYQLALEHFGVADEVITYTSSDFGRTLRTNGRGTDHAWGGNQFVLGGPVAAGQVYGTFPTLALGGNDDVGKGGRILPSTSTDEFFAELASWFGVSATAMAAVLPNLAEFHDISVNDRPVGFLKPAPPAS